MRRREFIALLGSDAAADVTSQRDGGVPIADLIRAVTVVFMDDAHGVRRLVYTSSPSAVFDGDRVTGVRLRAGNSEQTIEARETIVCAPIRAATNASPP